MVNNVGFVISKEDLASQRPETRLDHSGLLCERSFITEKASYIDIRRGWGVPRSLVLASVSKRVMYFLNSVQFSSVTQSCLTPCNPLDCSKPGLPVHHQLLEFTQTYVH